MKHTSDITPHLIDFLKKQKQVKDRKAPIHTLFEKRFIPFLLDAIRARYTSVGPPNINADWESKFKTVLRGLRHHDEYL